MAHDLTERQSAFLKLVMLHSGVFVGAAHGAGQTGSTQPSLASRTGRRSTTSSRSSWPGDL